MDEKQLQNLWELHAQHGGFKDFNEFKGLMNNPEARKIYFDDSNKELGFKDYDEFENILGVKKKDVSQIPSGSISAPQSSEEIKTVDLSEVVPPKDKSLFERVKEADDLINKKLVRDKGAYGVTEEIPDEKSIEHGNQILSELESQGYKKDFVKNIHGVDDLVLDFADATQQGLADLYKQNPIQFEGKVNEAKNSAAVYKSAYENTEGTHDQKKYAADLAAYNYGLKDQHPDVTNYFDVLQSRKDELGKHLTGDQLQEANKRFADTYSTKINADNPAVQHDYDQSPLKGTIGINQYAGLKQLQLFEPEKYEQAGQALSTPIQAEYTIPIPLEAMKNFQSPVASSPEYTTTDPALAAKNKGTLSQKTIDQRIGQEQILQDLDERGLQSKYKELISKQHDLDFQFRTAVSEEEKDQIREEYLNTQFALSDLQKTASQTDQKYPLNAKIKFDNQVKELTNSADGIGGYMAKKFAYGVGDMKEPVEKAFTNIFGSEADKARLQMRIRGEESNKESDLYLPENLRSNNSDVIIQPSKQLKESIDKILDGRKLSDLSQPERDQIKQLVINNQGEINTVTNPAAGKSKNFWSKSTLYNTAGFTADIASFLYKMQGAKSLGLGNKGAELTTLFTDGYNSAYNQATKEGMSPSQANGYALLHGGVMTLAGTVSSKFEAIKGILGQGKSALSKEILGLGEEGWNAIVNKNKSVIGKIASASGSILKDNAKMIATFGVGTSIANDLVDKGFFNKNISGEDMFNHAVNSAKEMVLGSIALAGAGFLSHMLKSPVTMRDKAAIWELGDNPELNIERIKELEAKGELTPADSEKRIKTINEIAENINKIPDFNDKGKPLTDIQKSDYLYNTIVKNKSKEAKSDLPPSQSEKAEREEIIADKKNEIILADYTDKQLEARKAEAEKQLIPEKDADGKDKEINPKVKLESEAELEVIKEVQAARSAHIIGEKGAQKLKDANNVLRNLNIAKEMEQTGEYNPAQIRLATQWEKAHDGKWRYEVSGNMDFNKEAIGNLIKGNDIKLGDLLSNEVISIYPEIKDISISKVDYNSTGYNPTENKIHISNSYFKIDPQNNQQLTDESKVNIKSIIAHEMQHIIQKVENFPRGGSANKLEREVERLKAAHEDLKVRIRQLDPSIPEFPKMEDTISEIEKFLSDPEKNNPFNLYQRVAGEVEARNVQTRLNYNDKQRIENTLASTEDIDNQSKIYFDKKFGNTSLYQDNAKRNEAETQANGDENLLNETTPTTENEAGIGSTEEDKFTGVKRSVTEATRTQLGLPKVEFPKMGSDLVELEAAKKRIDNGEVNPIYLVTRILTDKKGYATPQEVFDMQYFAHQLERHSDDLTQQLAEAKTPEEHATILGKKQQLSDLIDAQTEAAQLAGNIWGKTGNAMQPVIDMGFNISRQKADIKEAYGGEIPRAVQEKLNIITKERDEAVAARARVEEQLRQKMSKEGFEKIRKQADKTKKIGETKEQLRKEEQVLLNELKKSIRKDLGGLHAGIPIPKETLEALGKLAVNYVKQGVNGLEALIDKLHEHLSKTGISRHQLKQALSEYDPLTELRETNRLNKKVDILDKKLENNETDFTKPTREYKTFRRSNDWVRANQRVANAEFKIKIEKRKAFESQKNMFQKGLMWMGRLTRLSVLSGYNVLAKLGAAATVGAAAKRPVEQIIGGIYSKVFKGIAEKAPIEGYFNANAEVKFYKEFFNPKKFVKNSWEILKTGSTPLGKRLGSAEYEHVPGLYLPTDLHQIIKDPVKRATFEASFKNAMVWAEKNGLDINDPLVINSLETAAYKRAQYEIFQEQNWLSRKFISWKSSLEKQGNTGAIGKFLVDFMIPVSTVPSNIVRRIVTTSPIGLIRGGKEVVQAYRKGIESLKPEEADHVMQQLKQGTLGTALWLIGWYGASQFGGLYSKYNPNKQRKEGDLASDEMEVGRQMIPKPVQHALPLEIIQWAATARHIFDNYVENKNATAPEALYKAGMASIGALAEQIPVVETPVHLVNAAGNPYEADRLKEDVKRRVEPQILRETGVIGSPNHADSPAIKFLTDKEVKVKDINKEGLHPVDDKGNKIHVSDDKAEQVKDKRQQIIEDEISSFRKTGGIITEEDGTEREITSEEVEKLSKKQLEGWLMGVSSDASDKAIEEVFGKQPPKPKKEKIQSMGQYIGTP